MSFKQPKKIPEEYAGEFWGGVSPRPVDKAENPERYAGEFWGGISPRPIDGEDPEDIVADYFVGLDGTVGKKAMHYAKSPQPQMLKRNAPRMAQPKQGKD